MEYKQHRILVIEDHIIAQKIALAVLHNLGYQQVDIAENGTRGLELFKQSLYDLVFVDLGLPDFDGYTVTAKIRELENKNYLTPIIGLSVHSCGQAEAKGLAAGMNGYLIKPLTFENANSTLNKFLLTEKKLAS